jgi:two-component system, OmpR family, phosphate regulon response regulator PhoB
MRPRARQENFGSRTAGRAAAPGNGGGAPAAAHEVLQIGDIVLDAANYRVMRGLREVRISPAEFRLLAFMMQNANRLITREQLRVALWGGDPVNPRTVDVYVGRLRRALNRGRDRDPIRTVRYAGYSFGLGLEKAK